MRRASRAILAFGCVSLILQAQMAMAQCDKPSNAANDTSGIVYDIDYLGASTQILLASSQPASNPPFETANNTLQGLLQVGFQLRHQLRVTYDQEPDPNPRRRRIKAVMLQDPTWSGKGRIECMSCTESGQCEARIHERDGIAPVTVTTREPRAQGILLTALADERPVQELKYGPTKEIERVKVNNPDVANAKGNTPRK